ncbi:MAG: integration host factor subunit beta [Bacteroidales bacterium]|nr:integration host factor subunit beta [Bacteroidales bacterium]
MTKKEIVKQISEQSHLTQLKTKEIVQLTFDAIIDTLVAEGRIELRNFGVFEVKLRKPRRARNPRTNQTVEVDAKYVVTFQPGKIMEDRVRRLTPPETASRLMIADDEDDDDLVEDTDEQCVPVAVGASDAGAEEPLQNHARRPGRNHAPTQRNDDLKSLEKPLKPR